MYRVIDRDISHRSTDRHNHKCSCTLAAEAVQRPETSASPAGVDFPHCRGLRSARARSPARPLHSALISVSAPCTLSGGTGPSAFRFRPQAARPCIPSTARRTIQSAVADAKACRQNEKYACTESPIERFCGSPCLAWYRAQARKK